MGIALISSQLDTAIKDVEAKLASVNETKKNYDSAVDAHSNALQKALVIRNQLTDEIEKVLPAHNSRIRGVA
jgi:hypothetical protein